MSVKLGTLHILPDSPACCKKAEHAALWETAVPRLSAAEEQMVGDRAGTTDCD